MGIFSCVHFRENLRWSAFLSLVERRDSDLIPEEVQVVAPRLPIEEAEAKLENSLRIEDFFSRTGACEQLDWNQFLFDFDERNQRSSGELSEKGGGLYRRRREGVLVLK